MKSILQLCASQFTYTRFVEPIATHLTSGGFSVSVSFGLSDCSPSSLPHHYPFYEINIPRSFSILRYIKAALALKRLALSQSFDYIHCHTPSAALVARLCRLFGCPSKIIYTVHGFYFHEGMRLSSRLFHFAIEFFLSFLTFRISCVSYEDYVFATRFLPLARDAVFHIPNFVDSSLYKSNVSSHAVGNSVLPIRLAYAGRLVNEKGLRELLQAVFVYMSLSDSITFSLCGEALASDRDPLDPRLIESFSLAFPDRFFLLGMLNPHEMPSFYKSIDYLILPSYREGLPTVLIEAMMLGTPCLATSIRGCRELVSRSSTSLLFRPRSSSSILSCLDRVLVFHPLRYSLSRSAVNAVFPDFSSETVLPLYNALFVD